MRSVIGRIILQYHYILVEGGLGLWGPVPMGENVPSGGFWLYSLSCSPNSVTGAYWKRRVVARNLWEALGYVLW